MPKIPEGHLEAQPRNYKHLRIGFNVEDAPDVIVRKGRELYYGLTQWLDDEIGKVLKALRDSVAAENTVVIYTTDHGENMGEHGLW
ncbi:MAG: sulfatase-like hydrolase/transferase, partial [Burkholderiales bacterium]|nr:sulfatase-like hydrolase/transferase [Burkholderiales bacterium]